VTLHLHFALGNVALHAAIAFAFVVSRCEQLKVARCVLALRSADATWRQRHDVIHNEAKASCATTQSSVLTARVFIHRCLALPCSSHRAPRARYAEPLLAVGITPRHNPCAVLHRIFAITSRSTLSLPFARWTV